MLSLNPLTRKKLRRFRSIKRGYYSFLLFCLLVLLSLLAELLVNGRALVVHYQGQWLFPTYGAEIPGRVFGLDYDYETNYRQLRQRFIQQQQGDWVLLPPVPWNPYEQDFRDGVYPPTPPSLEQRHLLGTDNTGRDVLARLVYGFRIAIGFAFRITSYNVCYTKLLRPPPTTAGCPGATPRSGARASLGG